MRIITIGRSPDNDVVVSEQERTVSKSHALLMIDRDGNARIRDCESTNGTFVNGKKITEAPVSPKDEVRLGEYRLDIAACLNDRLPGQHKEREELKGEVVRTVTIGRNATNTIVVPFPDVSGEHADIVVYKNGDILLRDRNSTNGTTVNGAAIASKKLVKGDRVVLSADRELKWEAEVYGAGRRKKTWLIAAAAALVLLVCGTGLFFMKDRLFPVNIAEKYGNAVVIIRHDYVYKVDLGDNHYAYFTKTEKGFTEYDAGKNKPVSITGTGFFVSPDGKIITNRHVAVPWDNDEDTKALKQAIDNLISVVVAQLEQRKSVEILSGLLGKKNNAALLSMQVQKLNKLQPVVSGETVFIGAGLNDTHIESNNDMIGCLYLRDSGDRTVDVAMIQVKNKALPAKVKEYVHLDNAVTDNGSLKPGMKLTMIGYPTGFFLGKTTEGLKASVQEGTLSRAPDDVNIGHNLPAVPGSSGSPVFDGYGHLVGVNNQQLSDTQTFNFAILARHAVELYQSRK